MRVVDCRCGCTSVGAGRGASIKRGKGTTNRHTLARSQLHATHRHTHIYTHQWTLASAMGVCVVEVDVRG